MHVSTYHNKDDIVCKNFVFFKKSIFYNFEKDTKKLQISIYFRMNENNTVKM